MRQACFNIKERGNYPNNNNNKNNKNNNKNKNKYMLAFRRKAKTREGIPSPVLIITQGFVFSSLEYVSRCVGPFQIKFHSDLFFLFMELLSWAINLQFYPEQKANIFWEVIFHALSETRATKVTVCFLLMWYLIGM